MVAMQYHSIDAANTRRRPKRSARLPKQIVPMKSPMNSDARKPARPFIAKKLAVVGVRMPERNRPGAI